MVLARQSVIARAKAERRWNDGSPRQRNASAISVCPSSTSKASKWLRIAAANWSASIVPSRRTGGWSTCRFLRGSSSPGCETYRSEEHTSELQSRLQLVCRLLLEKKKTSTLSAQYGGTTPMKAPTVANRCFGAPPHLGGGAPLPTPTPITSAGPPTSRALPPLCHP